MLEKLEKFKNSADALNDDLLKPYSNYKLYNMIKNNGPEQRAGRNLAKFKHKTAKINRLATDSGVSYDSRNVMYEACMVIFGIDHGKLIRMIGGGLN